MRVTPPSIRDRQPTYIVTSVLNDSLLIKILVHAHAHASVEEQNEEEEADDDAAAKIQPGRTKTMDIKKNVEEAK